MRSQKAAGRISIEAAEKRTTKEAQAFRLEIK
jgi:hypothetical protein